MAEKLKESAQTPGEKVKKLMKAYHYTQAQLAEKLDCSENHISMIVRGERNLTVKKAKAIAEIFDVSPEWLLGFSNFRTNRDEKAYAIADRLVGLQFEKKAFQIYVGIAGYNIQLQDDSQYKDLSWEDFDKMSDDEQLKLLNSISESNNIYYIFQDRNGTIKARLSTEQYKSVVKEIADFAEFKIRKLIERAGGNNG